MTAEDFVDVVLTAAGEAAAGQGEGACVRVHGANYEYCFVPGGKVRVPAAEFRTRLEHTRIDGQQMFEVAIAGGPADRARVTAKADRSRA